MRGVIYRSAPVGTAVLRYQAISYRWAHNLEKYDAAEPKRFVGYYNALSSAASAPVAKAAVHVGAAGAAAR